MNKPQFVIACRACGWLPEESDVDSFKDLLEHKHEDGTPPNVGMVAYCEKDGGVLLVRRVEKTRSGMTKVTYDCSRCYRSYQAAN